MPKFKERPVEKNIAALNYVSGGNVGLSLPRDRWVQKVALRFAVVVGTAATTPHENGIINLIKNIRLTTDTDVLYDCSGWDVLQYNKDMHGVSAVVNDSPSGAATYYAEIVLELMNNPADNQDISAMVYAKGKSSFDLSILWGTPSDLGASGSPAITSGSVTVSLRECDLTPEEIARQGVFSTVKHGVKQQVYTATTSEFIESLNLPVSRILHYIGIQTVRTSTGLRSNDVISNYMLKQAAPEDEIVKSSWYDSIAADKRDYHLETTTTGRTAIDLRSDFGGYDARGMKDGDIKLHFNILTNVGTVRLFIQEVY